MKKTWKQNINEIKSLASKLPKTINESLALEGIMGEGEPMPQELPQEDGPQFEPGAEEPVGAPNGEEVVNIENFITTMRKQSLNIMAQLADNPDDSVYQFAKRIFQLAEKANDDKKEGKDINGQPMQQMQQPMA